MAMRRFQSTLPVRGATYRHVPNHRPEPYFNPRSPCGERPPPWSCLSGQRTDFNPRSPCGERPDNWRGGLTWVGISIHAPRAGSDKCFPRPRVVQVGISIHAPRAGSDVLLLLLFIIARISIHAPRAGSDGLCGNSFDYDRRISIHAPRAGSDVFSLLSASRFRISIHAPRAGSDFSERITAPSPSVFQSTLPVRGATYALGLAAHAGVFQSTLPVRGATMTIPPSPWLPTAFQSTLPVRGATAMVAAGIFHRAISIHAPRAGSDGLIERRINRYKYFNPRSPCGERRKAYRTV